VNIELPTVADLEKLAPEKKHPQLERNMAEVEQKSQELKEDKKKDCGKICGRRLRQPDKFCFK
jgi:predicted DNA-binding helix-hairpin-helix protein